MKSVLGNTRKPDLIFHKNGRINVSARVARLLNITHGDIVDIMELTEEYYLYVRGRAPHVGRHEGMAYRSNKRGNHFIVSSRRLCDFILRLCRESDEVRLCCGELCLLRPEGKQALPIITRFKL